MFGNLTGWHMVIILAIVLLLFGAPKLPGLARSIAQSMKIFKAEVRPESPSSAGDAEVTTAAAESPRSTTSQP